MRVTGTWLLSLLAANLGVNALVVAADLAAVTAPGPRPWDTLMTGEMPTGSAARYLALAGLQGLLLVPTVLVFVAWFYRAYQNLERRGHRLRFGLGWSIGAWFVPVLNLVRPKQIADELWRHSGDLAVDLADVHGEAHRSMLVVNVWWALWVVHTVIATALFVAVGAWPSGSTALDVIIVVMDTAWLLAGLVAMVVVHAITVRQDLAPSYVEGADSGVIRRPSRAVVASAAVASTLVALAVWVGASSAPADGAAADPSADEDVVAGSGRDTAALETVWADQLQVGDCFDDPPSDADLVSQVGRVPCEQGHDNEVFAIVELSQPVDAS